MACVIQMICVHIRNCIKHYMPIWLRLKWPQDIRAGGENYFRLLPSGTNLLWFREWPATKSPWGTLGPSTEGRYNLLIVPTLLLFPGLQVKGQSATQRPSVVLKGILLEWMVAWVGMWKDCSFKICMIKYFKMLLWFHVLMCAEILRLVSFFLELHQYVIKVFLDLHMDRILILGGQWGEKWRRGSWQEAESGGRGGIKEQTFLWKLKEDEEGGKSPSNTPTSSASKCPSTEAGWNETPYTKHGSNCTAGTVRMCLCVFWISFFSLVFGQKFWDKHRISLLQYPFWPLGSHLCRVRRSGHPKNRQLRRTLNRLMRGGRI